MSNIKAGIVVVNKFAQSGSKAFGSYIRYIDRGEAVRNEYAHTYNLFQDYMGDPEKTTGLFTEHQDRLSSDDKEKLKEVFATAEENGSLLWQTVISFDNEWLEENGLFDKENKILDELKLKQCARKGLREMLANEKLENAIWSGAFHYNTDNIHIHVALVEPQPLRTMKDYIAYDYKEDQNGSYVRTKDGMFRRATEKTIRFYAVDNVRYSRSESYDANGKIIMRKEYKGIFEPGSMSALKSAMANEILNEKDLSIQINNLIREGIVKGKTDIRLSEDKELTLAFKNLHAKMPRHVNKSLWNYNSNVMSSLKPEIDRMSSLYIDKYKKDDFKELEDLLTRRDKNYAKAYGDTGNSYKEKKLEELYTRLGNVILKEIREYDQGDVTGMDIEEEPEDAFEVGTEPETDISGMIENEYAEPLSEEEQVELESRTYHKGYVKWNDTYKEAAEIYYSKNPDYREAEKLFMEERLKGNALAIFDMGSMYEHGRNSREKKDEEIAHEYYQEALNIFEGLVGNRGHAKLQPYIHYRIGKHYLYGLGTEVDFQKAKEHFEKGAAGRNVYATYSLGNMYFFGTGVEQDYSKAAQLYESAIENTRKAMPYATYKLGEIYNKGLGVERDSEKAEQYYKSALEQFETMCDKKTDDNLEYKVGMMYVKGLGTDINEEKAVEYLTKAADHGNEYAAFQLGKILTNSDSPRYNMEMGIVYLKQAAAGKNQNPYVAYRLGEIFAEQESDYFDPEESHNYYAKALKEFEKDCQERGDNHLEYRVASMYAKGLGTDINEDKAIEYLTRAANHGNDNAQYQLGKMFTDVNSPYYDFDTGIDYLERAADGDKRNPYAQYRLGVILTDKEGGHYDPQRGVGYLKQSAEQDFSYAQLRLGIMYYRGDHVNKNKKIANSYFQAAIENGNEYAETVRENLQKGNRASRYAQLQIDAKKRSYEVDKALKGIKRNLGSEYESAKNQIEHERLIQEMEKER